MLPTCHRSILILGAACVVASCSAVRDDTDANAAITDRAAAIAKVAAARAEHERTSPIETDFWDWRVSYPTGRFDARWYEEARVADAKIRRGVPAGSDTVARKGVTESVLTAGVATSLGPRPLDWGTQAAFGRVGGRVNVIVTHPTDPQVAWFGSDGGGVWRTNNCCSPATTWSPQTDAPTLANIAIGALALDPNDPSVIYAGTGDHRRNRPFTFGAGGLLRSGDGGATWTVLGADVFNPVYTQPVGQFAQYRAISAIAIDGNDGKRLIVGTNQGLYHSIDAGANWTGPCFTNAHAGQRQDITGLLAIDDGTTSTLIAAVGAIGRNSSVRADLARNGANGIYRVALPTTATCPVGWTLVSRADNGWPAGSGSGTPFNQPGGNPLRRIDLAVAPSNTNVIYAQVMNLGVWRSTDGGTTWSLRASQPDAFANGCVTDSFGSGMQFQDYNAGLAVHPSNPDTVILSSTDVWRSTDGGATFRNLTCGYDEIARGVPGNVHVDQHARAFVAGSGEQLLVGHDGGVSYTPNVLATPPTFIGLNESVSTIEFYSGDITPRFGDRSIATRAIGGGAQDNGNATTRWRSPATPAAQPWTVRQGGDGIATVIEPIRQERWYYSAQFGFIGASTTGPDGEVDTIVTPDHSWNNDRRGFLMPYTLYKHGDDDTCPPRAGCGRMLAATFRVYESLSGGIPNTSWTVVSPDLTKALSGDNDLSIINKVEHAPSDPRIAIVGTNDGNVHMGFGLGTPVAAPTWIDVTGGNAVLPNRAVLDVVIHPFDPGIAYAALGGFAQNTPATPGHLYRLACPRACRKWSWTDKSGNLPNIPINAVAVNPYRPRQVFVGTDWGLYFTDDIEAASPVWQRFSAGLPSAMVWDLVLDRGYTTLAIFTRSRGAYVLPLPRRVGTLGD